MKRPMKMSHDLFNTMDISSVLRGWSYQPGQINVRLIRGKDGRPKLQLRLDLGLLQMELEGRPDGKRPHRAPTELVFQQRRLAKHEGKEGPGTRFVLSGKECQALREESAMFYHRYLSLFVLEQFEAVIRDTQHNLDVLDLCHQYGKSEDDRMCREQYRPYIVMMHARAQACDALRKGYVQTSIAYLRGGIRRIAKLFPAEHRRKLLKHNHEAHMLLDMIRQIRVQLPPDPRTSLQEKLREALAGEHYEEAAAIRDSLLAMTAAMAHPVHSPKVEVAQKTSGRKPAKRATRARKPRNTDGPSGE